MNNSCFLITNTEDQKTMEQQFEVLKRKKPSLILYPMKIFFKNEEKGHRFGFFFFLFMKKRKLQIEFDQRQAFLAAISAAEGRMSEIQNVFPLAASPRPI